MKIKTAELTGAALDWAVAKCEGKVLPKPKTATYEQFINNPVPFHLWEVNYHWDSANESLVSCSVTPIEVTRVGIDSSVGASSPSISFKDTLGGRCQGSIDMYYVTKDDAELESQRVMVGADLEFHPSTSWKDGGPIIEQEDISFRKYHNPNNKAHGKYYAKVCRESGTLVHWKGWGAEVQTGPTPLIAAMRCYVASKLGDEVDIPDELKETA